MQKLFSILNHNKQKSSASIFGQNRQPSFFKPVIQSKFTINQPNDIYEQEADEMANKVMRMTDNDTVQTKFFTSPISSVQRKCTHCEEEEKKLSRKEAKGEEITTNSGLESYVDNLNGSGLPLPNEVRNFYEPRLGYDFSNVKVHTDTVAAKSAQSINALAYTSGNNIVFNSGQYSPDTDSGKRLLGHELTHVVQQGNNTIQPKKIQRTLIIDTNSSIPPASASGHPIPLTTAVQGLLDQLCAAGHFKVDTTTGVVSSKYYFCEWHPPFIIGVTEADASSTPVGCNCLCDVVNHAHTTTISFRAGGPSTSPGSTVGAGAGHDGVQTDSGVAIDPRFQGQYRINGVWVDVPFYLLFSHELCGHALPKMQGTHAHRGPTPAGGTPPQERHAVDVERDIAAEQGQPRRPEDYSGDARRRP